MIKLLFGLGLFGLLTSSVFSALVLAGVRRFALRRGRVDKNETFFPPVSLFKPLHGAEPDLESRLASFFEQDYPEYEILFGA